MTAKRVSQPQKVPAKARSKPKATPATRTLAESAVLTILESSAPASTVVDRDSRRRHIAVEAYFIAERRGFGAAREFDDWVAAEAVIEGRLRENEAE